MDRPIIDFDQWTPAYRANWERLALEFAQREVPLAWTEAHDGFWVLGSAAAAGEVLSDWARFTSYNDLEGTGNGGRGETIPQMPYRLALGESDPPLHTERRRLEAPWFTPKSIRLAATNTQRFVDEAIDEVTAKGEVDLVNDIIIPTTARTTLSHIGFDGDWRHAAYGAHKAIFTVPDDPEYPRDALAEMRKGFLEKIKQRRAAPNGDLISSLAHGTVDGAPLGDDEAESMLNALVLGGFDTTAALTSRILIWLLENPEHQERYLNDAAFQKNAIEELLRYYPSATGVARTAVQDTELLGLPIAKGERVFAWFAAVNRDPALFPDGGRIDPERANAHQHFSFSGGCHRCLGAQIGKSEAGILTTSILRRLPELKIDQSATRMFPSFGAVMGFIDQPATFSPR